MTLPTWPNWAPEYFLIKSDCPICKSKLLGRRISPSGYDPYTPKKDTLLESQKYNIHCKNNCEHSDLKEYKYSELEKIGIISISQPFFGSSIPPEGYWRKEWLKIIPRF